MTQATSELNVKVHDTVFTAYPVTVEGKLFPAGTPITVKALGDRVWGKTPAGSTVALNPDQVRVKRDFNSSLFNEAVRIRVAIIAAGGMATKSAVSRILWMRWNVVTVARAHDICNSVEFYNVNHRNYLSYGIEPADISEFPEAEYVDIRWYEGNPFKREGK